VTPRPRQYTVAAHTPAKEKTHDATTGIPGRVHRGGGGAGGGPGDDAAAQDRAGHDTAGHGDESSGRQLIELRVYHFPSAQKRQAFEKFVADALVPALNRAGVRPVGAFTLSAKDNPELKVQPDSNDIYEILPHADARSFLELGSRLASDQSFLQAGGSVILAPKSDPAFTRYETSLLRAFATFPHVVAPAKGPN
jgi:hypothetical protein